jgi:hypothetical protein
MHPSKLKPGDYFRATQGPYRVSANGTKSKWATTGVMRFINLITDPCGNEILLAHLGHQEVRLIIKRASSRVAVDDSVVNREYKISKLRRPPNVRP